MRTQSTLVAPLLLLATLARGQATTTTPTTGPAATTRPADAATLFVIDQRRMIADAGDDTTPISPRPIESLVRLSIENGRLVAIVPPEVGDQANMPLPGGAGAVSIKRMHSRVNPENGTLEVQYIRLDDAETAHPRATFIQMMVDPRGLMMTLNEQTPTLTTTADLIDHPNVSAGADETPIASLRFSRSAGDNDAPATQAEDAPVAGERGAYLQATSFAALLDANHDAIVSTMGEALTSLHAMHVLGGLSDAQARQLMTGGGAADADVARGVANVIEALRADGSAAIDASVAKLSTLGPTAISALGAADRKGWSPDLKMSVDTVLAQVATVPASRAQQLLASPARLIDLLYWPDADIRRAAAQRLEPTLGKERLARFDPAKDPYAQATLIEAARAALPHDDSSK